MITRPLCAFLLLPLIASCAGTVDSPAPEEAGEPAKAESFELDRFRWQGDISGSDCVTVTNEWGDLRVRTTHRGEMLVSAIIQKIGTTEDDFEIRVEPAGECMTIDVAALKTPPRGRVDMTLLVPPELRLAGRTRDGLAEIKYTGAIEARTQGGRILIASSQSATATTVSGDIIVRLNGDAWHAPLVLESESGDIVLSLPQDADAELRVRTTGAIGSEFGAGPMTGSTDDRTGLETTLGSGGPELFITSNSGDVRIVARPE